MNFKVQNLLTSLSLVFSLLGFFQAAHAEVIVNPQALLHDIQDATVEAYKTQWPSENTEWSVTCLNLPTQAIHLQGDRLNKTIHFSNESFNAANNIAMLELTTDKTSYHLGVAVRVKVTKNVWEVINAINAKQKITPNHVKLVRHEFDDLGRYSLPETLHSERLQARVNLQPHAILETRNTEEIPFVLQNATINLIFNMPNDVRIKTQAVALENGLLGEQIRVTRQVQNKRRIIYTATVLRENTVEVKL